MPKTTFKSAVLVSAFAAAVMSAVPATANAAVTLGTLVCHSDGGMGRIFTSAKALRCTYSPITGGPGGLYTGTIEKFGLDIGVTGESALVWDVLAVAPVPNADEAIAGRYYGLGSEVSAAAGVGSKVLGGGFNQAIMLQPVSIQLQEGVNIAAGVDRLTLVPGAQ